MSANATASTAANASSASAGAPSNQLGPNSFITLLTAQLQAQDPLNPMDPNQMVNELTSINTLQQIMQIRVDMDALVGSVQAGRSSGASGSNGAGGTTAQVSPLPTRNLLQGNAKSQSN
jgi:flagellar basal-body rod modification protein FlgD